ncbi:MAG: hypothetical protein H7321_05095 [Bacteroidia bacterium]|nr:hypothetical protein [Bacteroidia bacterium]
MKKSALYLFFSLFYFSTLQAQYVSSNAASALAIQNRILLVGLAEANPDDLLLFQDQPKNIEGYYVSIEGKNQALKNAVTDCWKFSNNIQYLPLKQAQKLMKTEKDKYALLHFEDSGISGNWMYSDNKIERPAPFTWKKKDGTLIYDNEARSAIENLTIGSLVIDLPKKAIEIPLPIAYPSEGDLINAIQEMQFTLNYLLVPERSINQFHKETYQRADRLKTKILLIDSRDLSYKLKKVNLSTLYPYAVRVVPYDVIEKALKEKDNHYAIVTIARYDPSNSIHTITDAADGNVYYYKTFLTYEHGNQIGMVALTVWPFGVTQDQLTDYAVGTK